MPDAAHPEGGATHRSGAVARMVRMPVATLRVWERRYRLCSPALTPSGQRLYSAADVRRIALLKQLTELGHAIGSIAALDMAQLQAVAATHAAAITGTLGADEPVAAGPSWRVAVVGEALARRLQRPALRRWLLRPLEVLGPFDDLAHAAACLAGSAAESLLVQAPTLQGDWLAQWNRITPRPPRTAVLFRFASESVCEQLAAAGLDLLREPPSDTALGQWLQALNTAEGQSRTAAAPAQTAWPTPEAIPARRWDDAALADIAGLSTTIACECPKHIAELLMQLSHFESYSAQCANRSVADAELHTYLSQVAAASRARFEEALERVAIHEGLLLTQPAQAGQPTMTNPSRPEVGGAGG
ncbi:MerR family transcriptional regulator [Rhizobacter sp. AJA081-3]|nr:MerR family transcriptional regulator [Rhizobacter sp. AJA081-3]